MREQSRIALFTAALGLAACGKDPFAGDTCAVGPEPCAEGLICVEGTCASPNEVGDLTELDVNAVFEFAPSPPTLAADGEDTLQMRFTLREKDGRPITQDVVLWTEPTDAASLDKKRLQTDADGIATLTIKACNANREPCSSSFVVKIALGSRPVIPIAQSPAIRVTGTGVARDAGVTPGGDGGTVTPPPGNPLECSGASGTAALSAGGMTLTPTFPTTRISANARTTAVVMENPEGWLLAINFIPPPETRTGTLTLTLPSPDGYPAVGRFPAGTFTASNWPSECRTSRPGVWSGTITVTLTETTVKAVADAACEYDGRRVVYRACGSVEL